MSGKYAGTPGTINRNTQAGTKVPKDSQVRGWHDIVADAIENGDLDNFVKAKDPEDQPKEPVSACLAKGCKLPGGHEVAMLGDYSHAPAPITDINRAMRRRLLKARGVFGNRKRYDHR